MASVMKRTRLKTKARFWDSPERWAYVLTDKALMNAFIKACGAMNASIEALTAAFEELSTQIQGKT